MTVFKTKHKQNHSKLAAALLFAVSLVVQSSAGNSMVRGSTGADPIKPAGLSNRPVSAIDSAGDKGFARRVVRCPDNMVSVADDAGRSFCIDEYEWPNEAGKTPETDVSWVEAKMACIDAGKRLCTLHEWKAACGNGSRKVYPYGNAYDKNGCATEGKKAFKSGTFRKCGGSGVFDMVGNVWEWVEDKQGDYPITVGGSFNDGKDARCNRLLPSSMAARVQDAGFRCCR